jgi:ribosome-binding protein aMBF1 (putative translation factor)
MTSHVTNNLISVFNFAVKLILLWGSFMGQQDVSKMVRELRADLGLTQEQFAVKIGVTVATVNRWENDRAKPYPFLMRQLEKLQKKINRNKKAIDKDSLREN